MKIADPTALADQVTAATRQARTALLEAGPAGWGDTVQVPTLPAWLAEHWNALRAAITAGTAQACKHLAAGPRVAHAAVWRPGVLVCSLCSPILTPNSVEDSTCDRCRRYVRRIYPGAAQVGPVLLGYGLCRRCKADLATSEAWED